jgi:benzaldehyde dehydrogenase (NAD)
MGIVQEQAAWRGNIYLADWVRGEGSALTVIEPATGETLETVGQASPEQVDTAIELASEAQVRWAAEPALVRAAVIRRAAALMEQRKQTFVEWLVRESGSIGPKAEYEFAGALGEIHEASALPTQPEGLLLPAGAPGRMSIARRVPVGVVGVITPWNLPLAIALRALAPAIALGNAVVLKPDPKTPVIGGLLLAQLFEDAGLPKGVLSVVPGAAQIGAALVQHPKVNMICFTGSTAVGRTIGRIAGESLKKVSLELGGNNALIVLDDADLDSAASAGAFGSFLHQGQICVAAGRHLVHRSVAVEYAQKLAQRAKNLPVGDPFRQQVALGPIISQDQLNKIDKLVSESVAAGAELLAGGTYAGLFYQPTVLTNVKRDMPVYLQEVFGPVAPITVFDDDEEAVSIANETEYGLAAAVLSKSAARALSISRRLKAGMVHINDQTVVYEPHAPFGGMKSSGNGSRYGSPSSHEEFTAIQWLTVHDAPPSYPF